VPWKETCPMNERMEFIGLYGRDEWSMAELCREFGISRKTGYKWVARYTRHVRAQGEFRWHGREVFLSQTLVGEDVAFFSHCRTTVANHVGRDEIGNL